MYTNESYLLDEDGIPSKFIEKKNQPLEEWNDWEIAPWDLLINPNNELGSGDFGIVYLASWRGTHVAAKVVNENISEEKKKLLINELDTMTKIRHPNIVQFLGYIDKPFILVMEYMSNGDLLSYSQKNFLFNNTKINICLDILKGIAYLHDKRPNFIIHRDIKSENMLVTPSGVIKIADFGLTKIICNNKKLLCSDDELDNSNNEQDLTKYVGTPRYMAPEVKNRLEYDYKSDIWSCGVIFAELFEEERYTKDIIWHRTPKRISTIIRNHMLQKEPFKRMKAIDLIKIFEGLKNNYFCNCF